jgi:glycosyltransferase 2 family protein
LSKNIFSFLKFVFLLGIAFALLYLAFRGVDIKKTMAEISEANLLWLFLSIAVSLIAFLSRAYRWNLLIEPLGYAPRFKSTTYALMVGYLANLAVPRLGEVTRCGSLSKAENIPFNKLLGTVIIERLIDVISLLICLFLTAIIEYERLGNFLVDTILNPILEKLNQSLQSPVFIAVVVISLIVIAAIIIFYVRKSRKSTEESKAVHLIKGLIKGLQSIAQLKRPWAFLFHSVLIWVMYFFMAYLCFFSLPFTSGLSWSAGLFVLVVGGIGMSAPVQGGIGAYHLLVSQGLMLYGLSQQDGLAFATLLHTSQMLVVIFFGAISFLLLFLGNKENKNDHAGENQVQGAHT